MTFFSEELQKTRNQFFSRGGTSDFFKVPDPPKPEVKQEEPPKKKPNAKSR